MKRPSVRNNVTASSDAMIWVSGGFFVVSCTLLFLFIGHIAYHSLHAHWPRRVAVFEKTDGTLLAGEIHGYHGESLPHHEQSISLRTGYNRNSTQSISTMEMETVTAIPPVYPENVIAVELRESEPMFGLITQVAQLQHSLQTNVAIARVFLSEIESAEAKGIVAKKDRNAFEEILPSALASMIEQADEPIEIPMERWDEAIADFEQIVEHNQHLIRLKQMELSGIDKQLSASRKQGIRYAVSRNQSFVNTIDEIFRVAFELGAAEQAIYDVEASARFWRDQFQSDDTISKSIDESTDRIKALLKQQRDQLETELNTLVKQDSWVSPSDSQKTTNEAREFLSELAKTAKSAYSQQLRVNTDLAELDIVRNAFRIELTLLDCETIAPTHSDRTNYADSDVKVGIVSTRVGQSLEFLWRSGSTQGATEFALAKKQILCSDVIRYYFPNKLGWLGKLQLYSERWIEFLAGSPRRNGLAGGVFPAIWGTVVMTILMSIMVMPFGVMAAIYMREYAQHSMMLSIVRVTVHNLAGVPSIVYGVFGLAFFSYLIGGFIDGGPQKVGLEPLPILSWIILSSATMISILWLAYRTLKPQSKFLKPSFVAANRFFSFGLLVTALVGSFLVVAKVPFFEGLYYDELPNPTFGKGCLLWASFTMALLTLPIVIVTTEEALSSVPASLKEGSYACGATKWQTIRRLVLPYARPGIITGMILSVARGAGEVAPLMLVGVIPLASDLPLDTEYPYLHGSRSFMHLGYHIYSLGLQNPDINAARPMVYATIVLLMLIVFVLNSGAIWLRSKINRQMKTQQF
ncbi:MAG: ABC transporter permease subunit [Pirellula sp.]|jgi:ABC-type phosphate transport system permease subunit|nr:ABC transporter permease subunit [Pirellula sp.]